MSQTSRRLQDLELQKFQPFGGGSGPVILHETLLVQLPSKKMMLKYCFFSPSPHPAATAVSHAPTLSWGEQL